MVAIRHVRGEQVDDDVVEVEYATQAFLEQALMKEVASGAYPTQVINQLNPLVPVATVKVLGVPQEATSQDLHNAMVHYGSIQSVRLAPTSSGAGFVGYVVFRTKLAGKAATEAGYSFLGKERVRIVHPAVTKETEGSSPRFQLCLTNLPPNTTDWELHGIMNAVHAINWHIPRVPHQGMTHLRCHHALVDFANSVMCEQASATFYQLRGYNLLWYHPTVATCYRCGKHGHFQASCPSVTHSSQTSYSGVQQAGVSYAAATRYQQSAATPPLAQPQACNPPVTIPSASLDTLPVTDQVSVARLDTLEAQIVMLSSYFQLLSEQFDAVAKAVASIGQAVDVIAQHMSVPSQMAPVVSAVNTRLELPLANQAPLVGHSRVQMDVQANPIAQAEESQGSSKSVASMPPISPLLEASPQVGSDQARISGVEDMVRQLAVSMEAFFSRNQPSLILPTSQGSMLLPGSSHPKNTRVPSQRK